MFWLRRLLGLQRDSLGERTTAPTDIPGLLVGSARPDCVEVRRIGGRIATSDAIDFIGQFAVSPNGRFTLLWQDRATINGPAPGGRYVFLDDGRLVADRRMPRPQDGKVADDGTFILNDWGASDELSGTFHVFAVDGRPILSRAFAANLLNNGLSADGRLAVVQTCNAPGSPDSSVLAVFNLAEGREIACWQPASGWADGYEFPGSDRVRMLRRDRPFLDYALDGEFLDRRKWYADGVARGERHVIREALDQGEAVSGLATYDLRAGARVAIADPDDRFRAQSLRLMGEVEELAGDGPAALDAYRAALAIDPKVGVAKRAAALSRRIEAGPSGSSHRDTPGSEGR